MCPCNSQLDSFSSYIIREIPVCADCYLRDIHYVEGTGRKIAVVYDDTVFSYSPWVNIKSNRYEDENSEEGGQENFQER